MKYFIAIVAALVLLGGGAYYFLNSNKSDYKADKPATEEVTPSATEEEVTEPETNTTDNESEVDKARPSQEVVGQSVEGKDIIAYHYGEGDEEILFVGGVHGGYSYNTALLAYELMDYLEQNEKDIADNLTVTVIPTVNLDGLSAVTGKVGRFSTADVSASESEKVAARFNKNEVDLNRNFACDWAKTSTWRNQTVSGGSAAFSEPEAKAISDYVKANKITAAVVWFAAEGKVYPSACGGDPSTESVELAATYATAAGYGAQAEFDAYAINGDMVNWMAKEGIPAISVLLSDHKNTERSKNIAGVEAVLEKYSK